MTKRIKDRPRQKAGRKQKQVTPEQIAKCVAALQNGFKVEQAWQEAKITKDLYYRELERNPLFREEIESALHMPSKLSRKTMVQAIKEGSIQAASWWLGHHKLDRDDFREGVDHKGIPSNDNRVFVIANGKQLPWLNVKEATEDQKQKDAKKKMK